MSGISVGQAVPDFSAVATSDRIVRLSELRGQRLALYFYPRDNTPGCTVEGQQFRDLHPQFAALNTVIFGVSRDSVSSHEKFRAKHNFPFDLISDSDETLCRLFDVIKLKKNYGKEALGVERSTFLIDETGVLRREWRKVKTDGHAAVILAAVEALK
ncbi:MAG: peroxiredoxin [Synechococcaceae cyanobacterium SM1_2_3]|nr:peroxiredoxin [Synechococcaceae cyanobacterium SM1_2_3]